MKLTDHFTLEEMIVSNKAYELGIDNMPPDVIIKNLKRLANKLEEIRMLFNKPVKVSSGFRCIQLNRAIGSSDTSQHVAGCAADFHIDGFSPRYIVNMIIHSGIEFDQLIEEHLDGRSWVHISIPLEGKSHRKQALIIDDKGTRKWK